MTAPAIAADDDVPTVPTPASLTTAKRNAVRIPRLRSRTAGRPATTRLVGRVAADPQVLCADTSTASATREGAARALSDRLDMVPGVSIIEATELSEQQAHMGGLGRLLDDDIFAGGLGGDDRHADATLAFLAGDSRTPALPFLEVGPVTRKVDEDGRIKLVLDAGSLCELVAWGAGSLEVTAFDGWVLLRQNPDLIGDTGGRYGNNARVTRDSKGLERICLKQAHLRQLELGPDRNVLVVPLVDAGCVALVNPSVVMATCPPFITQILAEAPCFGGRCRSPSIVRLPLPSAGRAEHPDDGAMMSVESH